MAFHWLSEWLTESAYINASTWRMIVRFAHTKTHAPSGTKIAVSRLTDTPFTRYNRLSNRLSNGFDNRFDNGFDNRLYRVNGT